MASLTLTLPQALKHAVTAYKAGDFLKAADLCQKIIMQKQDYFDALHLLAIVQSKLGKNDEALVSFNRALSVRPNHADAFNNLSITLKMLKQLDDALASCNRALAAEPGHTEALYNRGLILHDLTQFDEALASFDRVLAARPTFAEAFNSRGITLRAMNRYEEALASYDRAIEIRPDYPEALNNRGNVLREFGRFKEALSEYRRAVTLQPDYADAHWNDALMSLRLGDFANGWVKYEWRWKKNSFTSPQRDFAKPLWLGTETIKGKTILVHSEQGFGDTIQFCRYVPMIIERGARPLLEVPETLQNLLKDLSGVAQVVVAGTKLPDFDLHCPFLSLPLAFGTRLETIPATVPYLHVSPENGRKWNLLLGRTSGPKIGLVWSGRPTNKNDRDRSINLESLLPLFDTDAKFVSLQKDIRPEDATVLRGRKDLVHFGDNLSNFSETAALLSNLDLVISVDTAVAHLAGALAKPVWVLLPYIPDWRWLLGRDDSPWYPTARLFRQDETRTWSRVVSRVHGELQAFVKERSSGSEMTHGHHLSLM